jgi:hypothetical protein
MSEFTGPRDIIVVNKLSGRVQFFDALTHELASEFEAPKFPHEVLISQDRTKAFISIYGHGESAINTSCYQSIARPHAGWGTQCRDLQP